MIYALFFIYKMLYNLINIKERINGEKGIIKH